MRDLIQTYLPDKKREREKKADKEVLRDDRKLEEKEAKKTKLPEMSIPRRTANSLT